MLPRAPCPTPLLYFGAPCHGNSVGYHESSVLSTVIFADKKTFNSSLLKVERIHLLAGIMLYSPLPSKRGRWRAVRAGRGAYSGCAFLTMEMRRSFKAPLPPCFAWSPSPAAAGEAGVRTFRPLAGMWF